MSVDLGDVVTELQAMGWIFPAVAMAGFAVSAILYWINVFGTRRVQQRQAQSLARSSLFWARWPAERFWSAPYDELAAESDRCTQIIDGLRQRRMLATPRYPTKRDQTYLQYLDNQIIDCQRVLGGVHAAMQQAVAHGRGPLQPPPAYS
ncbi:hypothetical protein FR943_02540 [Mycobacterium sp. TNTM28]|uniref:Uncharacterized protein n=1 Tax=[Mycobacterium] fortunisiensis TaxID=2600579 RepID=A0ABS6KGP2_9MYCO|nr:hypothetical protein [[Mycobacterium] fortunisiensis]MBU9762732.1 hypothetical protein [[Mycobacterium] fortunisiensis]